MPHDKSIYLYNTLTKEKECFEPLHDNKVGMYNCGPTVYDYAHIGNLRSYVFADILRRTFEWNGYDVKQVINITDIGHLTTDSDSGEDKMMKALKREGKNISLESVKEIADKYTESFIENLNDLNIKLPDKMPRASEHIENDIKMIEGLMEKDLAYKTSDGLYFDTSEINYGKLGGISEKTESRIDENPEKKNRRDFALWKFSSGNIGWDSPWGKGFPGWHIECSAMSMEYLGETLDVHTGGVDHIPVHHNNEIAQSESYTGKEFARFWMHNEFVTVDSSKMAKSEGTGLTLHDIEKKGYSPLSYRYWLLTAHYRSQMDLSWNALDTAENSYRKLMSRISEIENTGEMNIEYMDKFTEKINDDLDTPGALAVLWELMRDGDLSNEDKRATAFEFDNVLGLGLESHSPAQIPDSVQKMAREREEARKDKDFEKADMLRGEIESKGFEVKDTSDGPKVIRKS